MLQAAGCLHHGPAGKRNGKNLPARAVKILEVGETGHAQAGRKCGKSQQNAARQRPLTNPEEMRTGKNHVVSVVGLRYPATSAICRSDSL